MSASALAFGIVAVLGTIFGGGQASFWFPAFVLLMLTLIAFFAFAIKWINPEKPLPGERLLSRSER